MPKQPERRHTKPKKKPTRGLREREGNWHYRYKLNGHEYSGNTGLAATPQNINDALQIRASARKNMLTGGSPQQPEIYPFSKAAEKFLDWCDGEYRAHPSSAGRIRTSFASLARFFQNEPVMNIHEGRVDDFKTYRRALRIQEVTLRHDLHNLSLFFQYAIKQRWCSGNPVEKVKIPSDKDAVRIYVLTEDEEARYFAEAHTLKNKDLYDLARMMILQGCRPEELMALQRVSVDLKHKKFHITKGKSSAARRSLIMEEETAAILARRLGAGFGQWVFPSPRVDGRHITKLNNAHNAICERVNLDIVLYDFRHTFATRMAGKGCPLADLAKLLGHSNLRSIMKYVHPDQHSMDDAMLRYGQRSGASTSSSPFRPPTKENDGESGSSEETRRGRGHRSIS